MKEYNSAFFGLFENLFLCLKEEYGKDKALSLFRKIIEQGLNGAYGQSFAKGSPNEFAKLVGDRDNNVGLRVTFPVVEKDKVVYQFHDDPFPGLKDKVGANELVDTYMNFKVKTILGDDWTYKMTKHLWNNDDCTEIVMVKRQE